jgi:hypothetical protein
MNRFVSGGRIYQRNDVWISFSAKKRMVDGRSAAPACLPPTPEAFLLPASNCIFLGDCFKKAGRILCRPRAKRKMSPFKP